MDTNDPVSVPWNSLYLKPPCFEFFESSNDNFIRARKAILNEFRANKSRDLLFVESVTLSKFMLIRKNKYRNDKGFKAVGKILKAVERVYQLDMKSVTTLMKANLSSKFVPSKQLCQWLLVKLQSNGLLLNRIMRCCESSISMLNHRLRTGHVWIEVTLTMAMISRIWSFATHLMKTCCYSYQILAAIQNDLPSNPEDKSWNILANYVFPENLEHWIDQPHNIPSFSNDVNKDNSSSRSRASTSANAEHSVRVMREIKAVKSLKDLKLFLSRERKRRHKKRKFCLSSNLDDQQWLLFEKYVIKISKKLLISQDETSSLEKIHKKMRTLLLFSTNKH